MPRRNCEVTRQIDGDTVPLVHGGRVYWATAAPSGEHDARFQMVVQSRRADGTGSIRTEATEASQPAFTNDGLYVVRSTRDRAGSLDGDTTLEHLTGPGDSQVIARYTGDSCGTLQNLVGDGARLAFVQSTEGAGGGVLYVLDTRTWHALAVKLATSGRTTSVAMCGDILVWNSADGSGGEPFEPQYVLNLQTQDLARIGVPYNYSGAFCKGDLVGWRALSPDPRSLATTTLVRWLTDRG